MFEQDLPGDNKSGLSFQEASAHVPLEACITMNGSWGFSLTDTSYKSTSQLVRTLAKGAGLGANLLLNVGPMPNGEIQPEFITRLNEMGNWLKTYGESIYGTEAGYLKPQTWGCITKKGNKLFIHVFKAQPMITLKDFPFKKLKKAYYLKDNSMVKATLKNGMLNIPIVENINPNDEVIVLEITN